MRRKDDPGDLGHGADTPWKMPLTAWKRVARRVWNQSWIDNIGLVAAGVAFYGFLAIVPLLGILVLTYGLVAEPATVVTHVSRLLQILPADVALLIGQLLLAAVQSSQNISVLSVIGALAVALYAGGNGAGAIMTALNIAYEEKEKRSLARFYLTAFAITLVAVLVGLAALATAAAVQSLENFIDASGASLILVQTGAYALLALAAAAIAATLYRFGPSRERARWAWLTPGSIFTALVWLLLTAGFGFYVTKLTNYSATYGSIAAIVMLITWLYLSAYVFLFGAELNAELEHQTAKDSTTGPPEPLGRRGAWAADHVANEQDDGSRDDGPSLAEAGPPPAGENVERPERK